MNNIFNMKRFLMLLSKQSKEHYKTYLMSTAVLCGIIALALGFTASINNGEIPENGQFAFFTNFLIIAGTIFTSMIFSDLGDKKKAMPILTLPVSNLERYLVIWLYSFVFFLIVFLTSFYVIDIVILRIGDSYHLEKNKVMNIFGPDNRNYIVFLTFLFLNSVSFLGAIYFNKLHFIKTTFLFFIFMIVLTLINQPLIRLILDADVKHPVPFQQVNFVENGKFFNLTTDESGKIIMIVMVLTVTFLLWTAAFYKLKEKQV